MVSGASWLAWAVTGPPGAHRDPGQLQKTKAGLREECLDERERRADERDGLADDREALANQRDSDASLREKWLDERERTQGDSAGHARALPAAGRPYLSQQLEWALALRKRTAATIAALAATEEKIALFHDELAALRPGRADEYRRIAEHARTQAARAREIVRRLNSPHRPQ